MGIQELGIVLVIILVIFGGSQLPKLARNLGQAQKEFKDGLAQGEAEATKRTATTTTATDASTPVTPVTPVPPTTPVTPIPTETAPRDEPSA